MGQLRRITQMPQFKNSGTLHPKLFECKSGETGRRAGLRIQFPKGSGGSSPSSCTIKKGVVHGTKR